MADEQTKRQGEQQDERRQSPSTATQPTAMERSDSGERGLATRQYQNPFSLFDSLFERMQRDFFLREQMKAIQKELGDEDEQASDIRELEERIAASGMPEEAEKEARHELDRMRRMPIQAAEYSVIKTYLDLMVSLPWQVGTEDNLDIAHARHVLDEDHYGLEDIKDRILEFLAVRKLRAERKRDDDGERSL